MKKRILAVVCMLAVLVGVFAVGAAASTGTDGKYDVGYVKVDVNPWIQSEYISIGIENTTYTDADPYVGTISINNPNNTAAVVDQPFVKVPLAGYSNSTSRLASALADDNGDGLIGEGDGVAVTVTSVTDDWDKTVMYVTIDSIGAYKRFTTDIREAIVAAMPAGTISASEIMVSASHSHAAPDINECVNAEEGTALRAYYDYYVARVAEAAVNAYEDSSPATMTKGSIEAVESMVAQGYTYSSSNTNNENYYGQGIRMNFNRHYVVTNKTDSTNTWVSGDNFGQVPDDVEVTRKHVSEVNDTMSILQFTRDDGDPVALIQWQAHPSMFGSASQTNLSSDYINALRYRLENNATEFGGSTNYCVGFWQGTGGNLNPMSSIAGECVFRPQKMSTTYGWPSIDLGSHMTLTVDTSAAASATQNRAYRNALYGYLLGQIALDCLDSEMTGALDMSNIRTIQSYYTVARQTDSEGLIAAAHAWKEAVDLGESITYPYTYTYGEDVYVLNSQYHANSVLDRENATRTSGRVELNAIMLGENVAMVVAPPELFDRYSLDNTLSDTSDNDWEDLIGATASAGMPFILSKSNDRAGYMPNNLAYTYNTDPSGTATVAAGSYEANTSLHTQGAGEQVVAKFGAMLETADTGYVTGTCPKCGEVEWQPLIEEVTYTEHLGSGHYYLTTDIIRPSNSGDEDRFIKTVNAGESLCLNLNGYTLESEGRAFLVQKNGTLSIINTDVKDPGTGGVVRAYSGNNNSVGGLATVYGTFNLYGGTLEFVREAETGDIGTGCGGILSLAGTMNMYDGTIKGAELVDSTDTSLSKDGCGSAIYMWGGTLNMSGGAITSGTNPSIGNGSCVYIVNGCFINLSNDASIEDIYYGVTPTSNVKISGTYTGTIGLSLDSGIALAETLPAGKLSSADLTNATITCSSSYYVIETTETQLNLVHYFDDTIVAAIGLTGYTTLQDAVDAYTEGDMITMINNETAATTVDEGMDIYLDLNGKTVSGAITVSSGTLYCKDSATDDYSVIDGVYGKITSCTGAIDGIPEESTLADDGYLMISEEGVLSFHRVNLDLTHMILRPITNGVCAPSLYYKSNFKADKMVADRVQKYGVAMSVDAMPNATNMKQCHSSYFTTFVDGAEGNSGNGTLLKEIMRPTNAALVNKRNATVGVYGRAYILTEDGYMFGGGQKRSLQEQVEAANWSEYSADAVANAVTMCKTYGSIMCKWDIPEITSKIIMDKENPVAKEGETLKVLAITSSFGLNTTQLLYDVAVAEGYAPENVIVARLYTSGCTLEKHLAHAPSEENPEGLPVYQYTKITGETGKWTTVYAEGEATLLDGLQDEDWDIIFMQQGAAQAPVLSSYTDENGQDRIDLFRAIVNQYAPADAKFVWNMLWAYQGDSTQSVFVNTFGSNQMAMYEANINAVSTKVVPRTDYDAIIPSGTVIQNARTSAFGDTLCRDTYHLNNYGGIMAAYGLFATLTGQELTEINIDAVTASTNNGIGGADTITTALTDTQKAIIMESVNNALADPFQVTESEYK